MLPSGRNSQWCYRLAETASEDSPWPKQPVKASQHMADSAMVLWATRLRAAPPAAPGRAICARLILPTSATCYCRGHPLCRLPSGSTVLLGTLHLCLRPARIRTSAPPRRRPGRCSRCRRLAALRGRSSRRGLVVRVVPPSLLLPLQLLHLILPVFDLGISGSASPPAAGFFGGTSSKFFGLAFCVLLLVLL